MASLALKKKLLLKEGARTDAIPFVAQKVEEFLKQDSVKVLVCPLEGLAPLSSIFSPPIFHGGSLIKYSRVDYTGPAHTARLAWCA